MEIPGELIPITLFIMAGFSFVGFPIARAIAKRIERSADQPRIPNEVSARLERMEQAIDTIAVEIERISEAQRFTTKLLADRARDGQAIPASADR